MTEFTRNYSPVGLTLEMLMDVMRQCDTPTPVWSGLQNCTLHKSKFVEPKTNVYVTRPDPARPDDRTVILHPSLYDKIMAESPHPMTDTELAMWLAWNADSKQR